MKDDFNSVCSLISATETAVNGVLTETRSERLVFCQLLSNVTVSKATEGKFGATAEVKIKLSDISEYQNERYAIYNSKEYEITRTYQNGDEIELTLMRGIS